MIDINERAIKMSKLNATQNEIANVDIEQSDGFEKMAENDKDSLIVTNPPIRVGKKFIYSLFEESKKYLHENGERSEEHTSELQSRGHLVCRLLLEKKKQY